MPFLLSIRTVFTLRGGRVWYDDQRQVHQQIFAGEDSIGLRLHGHRPRRPRQRRFIYFLGLSPGRYQAIIPTFVVDWDPRRLTARIAFGELAGAITRQGINSADRRALGSSLAFGLGITSLTIPGTVPRDATVNHDLADVHALQDTDAAVVRPLAVEHLAPAEHQLLHRLGGFGAVRLVALGGGKALKPDWQPADLDGIAARTGSWKEASWSRCFSASSGAADWTIIGNRRLTRRS